MRTYNNGFILEEFFFLLPIQNKEKEIWEGGKNRNVRVGNKESGNSKKKKYKKKQKHEIRN